MKATFELVVSVVVIAFVLSHSGILTGQTSTKWTDGSCSWNDASTRTDDSPDSSATFLFVTDAIKTVGYMIFGIENRNPSAGNTLILPNAFEVTRGTLSSGTLADLLESDNPDLSVRGNSQDLQAVVQVDVSEIQSTRFRRIQGHKILIGAGFSCTPFDLHTIGLAKVMS